MAHTICGIDLGAFSIKFVMLEVGFRRTQLRGLLETAVPSGDAPLLERQAEAIRDGLAQISGEATPYLAMPGDVLSIRLLDLPFTDPRKIEQVIGYELEGQIVHPLEDVVYDHMQIRSGDGSSAVLAVAAKRDDVGQLLAGLEAYGRGMAPRALYAAPIIYRAFADALPAAPLQEAPDQDDAEDADDGTDGGPNGASDGCRAILDFGHLRTNLCILREGQVVYARTITRGGLQLTTAIAQAFDVPFDRAEQAKRSEAELLSGGRAAASPAAAKLDTVLRQALAPFVREIRQTFASVRATSTRNGDPDWVPELPGDARRAAEPGSRAAVGSGIVDMLLITGGTGRLRGLPEFLEGELGIPARFLPVRGAAEMRPRAFEPTTGEGVVEADESSSYALATAIALTASRGAKEIDLRRGPYVYRANFSMLRQRAVHLGLLVAGMLLAIGLDVGAALTNLGSDRKDLDQQLKTATQELFGQPQTDAKEVTQQLRKGFKEELAPIPKATAFDLLDQISRKVPSGDDIDLDVLELDIRPKKTFIKGTVDSAAAVDDIGAKLKEIDCFDEVTKGAITEVSGGGKQFTINIASKCP